MTEKFLHDAYLLATGVFACGMVGCLVPILGQQKWIVGLFRRLPPSTKIVLLALAVGLTLVGATKTNVTVCVSSEPGAAATLTNGAQRIVNRYDWRSRRIGKDVYSCELDASAPDGIRWELVRCHDFAYDDWNLIHETVTTAGPTPTVTETQYFWEADLSSTLEGAGGVGGLLAVSCNGAFYFPVYDNNGNVAKYVDESGSVIASYFYDDFGRTISQTGPLATLAFTVLLRCGEMPVLKGKPKTTGDWSLSDQGWKRTTGNRLGFRTAGTPMDVLEHEE